MAGPNYQGYTAGQKLATTFGDAGDITKTYGTDFSEDRQRVEDALMARMQTQLDRDQGRLDQKLANQGIRIGSDAFSSGQADFGRNVNDARMAAILAGGQEQSRMVGLERDRAMFENDAQNQNYGQLFGRATFGNNATQGNNDNSYRATAGNNQNETSRMNAELAKIQAQNAARSQYVQEQLTLRNQPINETTALMSGSQVQQPNFQPTNMPTIPTVDMAGLINDNYQQRSNNAMAQYQAQQGVLGGLMGLGSAAIMASDKRVKKDVKKVGRLGNQNLYEFHYKGEDKGNPKTVGFMAQEVERTFGFLVDIYRGTAASDLGDFRIGTDLIGSFDWQACRHLFFCSQCAVRFRLAAIDLLHVPAIVSAEDGPIASGDDIIISCWIASLLKFEPRLLQLHLPNRITLLLNAL